MRKIDIFILLCGVFGTIVWVVNSGKDGFKGNNAMIIARTLTISSTINGQIDNQPPAVGTRVSSKDLLVHILNNRIDRSRLAEFESQITYLQGEIETVNGQQAEISVLLQKFKQRASAYSIWMLGDIRLKRAEKQKKLNVAIKRSDLRASEVDRARTLYRKKITSRVNVQVAKAKADIARNEVSLTKAQLSRVELQLNSLKNDGVFFRNGDTSYWEKMVDTLSVHYFDNQNKTLLLQAQLVRAKSQEKVERARISSNYKEEHLAPFSGIVNASFVNKGTKVISGTALVQLLDCTQPVVIIPIPENKIGAFSVGMKVTVYPIDSQNALPGTIKFISSGAMIGQDKTIQMQQDLLQRGTRAIVSLDQMASNENGKQSCETTRKAVVIIHNNLQPKGESWLSSLLGLDSSKIYHKFSGLFLSLVAGSSNFS